MRPHARIADSPGQAPATQDKQKPIQPLSRPEESCVPGVTVDLIRKLKQIDIDYTESRLRGIQSLPGNPYGIRIERFGSATAFVSPGLPNAFSNRVVGLSAESADRIDEIVALYRDRRTRCRFDLFPGDLTLAVARQLAEHGLMQMGFRSILYGDPASDARSVCGSVEVQEVRTPHDFEIFQNVTFEGFAFPPENWPAERTNTGFWLGCPGWHLFLARIGGVPTSAGVLFTKDRVGYLASTATVAARRGQGGQSALIHRRLQHAAERECTVVASQTMFLSPSQHNLERLGLRLACTKAIWTEPVEGRPSL